MADKNDARLRSKSDDRSSLRLRNLLKTELLIELLISKVYLCKLTT